ncbi:ABC transporter ATP-binding protein [Streptococcus pneumoniae]|nr:ABC transporter ATP-binding protein [Streptococcus pneumoniae]
MKILVQNNQPTSGNIISSDNVGYLIEEPKLFLSKTGLENLKYLSNLYGVDYNQPKSFIPLSTRCNLQNP